MQICRFCNESDSKVCKKCNACFNQNLHTGIQKHWRSMAFNLFIPPPEIEKKYIRLSFVNQIIFLLVEEENGQEERALRWDGWTKDHVSRGEQRNSQEGRDSRGQYAE